eukprot:GFUD01039268.1.p1 GENE.GFUD01039268.1~~GFUD01039268.1.p1  ORF type:complete len:901 (+),score=173.59 GFUD01039268.1:240-2705(+)
MVEEFVFVNKVHDGQPVNLEEPNPKIDVKFEVEEYTEQAIAKSSLFGAIKEEKPCVENVEQYNNANTKGEAASENDCNYSQTAMATLGETTDGEEGEIRDSPEYKERNLSPESPKLTHYEEMLIDETLNIEPNPSEIEELLNATKHEIEKFLVVRKPVESMQDLTQPLLLAIDLAPSPGSAKEDIQSSTPPRTKAQSAADTSVDETLGSGLFGRDSSQYRYPCNLCSYKTNVGLNIKRHMKNTHKCFYKFRCSKCIFESSYEELYKLHSCETSTVKEHKSMVQKNESRPDAQFLCTMCSFKTHIPDFITVHMKNNHQSFYSFKCNQCDFETSQYHKFTNHNCSSAQDHVIPSHSNSVPASSLCMRCGRHHLAPCNHPADSYCDEPNCLKIGHVKSLHHPHTMSDYKTIKRRDSSISLEMPPIKSKIKAPVYPCNECGYKTSKPSMIKYHAKRSHQSPYLFTCNICKFSTTDNNMFPSHRCKEEVIQCPKCDFTTVKSLLMKRHISTQHESQVYACGQCSYKATTLDSFKKHQLLFCNGNNMQEGSQSRKLQRESYSCDRCEYEGTNLHRLRKHKIIVHSSVPSHHSRSRGVLSPNERSLTPLRRRDIHSPYGTSSNRIRTPSNRSMTPNRGPTSPFPAPSVLYLEPAREEDLFTPNTSMTERRRSEPKPWSSTLLCMRCGRRHAAPCKHSEDSWCSEPDCGRTGHVVSLHHPKTINDCKLIKSKIPGLVVREPLEKYDSPKRNSRSKRIGSVQDQNKSGKTQKQNWCKPFNLGEGCSNTRTGDNNFCLSADGIAFRHGCNVRDTVTKRTCNSSQHTRFDHV